MPDALKQPVTVGNLLTIGVDRIRRPATIADLVSALRAEGVLVVEKVDGEWPAALLSEMEKRGYTGDWEECWEAEQALDDIVAMVDALAEAQPFPPVSRSRDMADPWPCIHGSMYSHVLNPEAVGNPDLTPIVCVGRPAEAQP